jgi:predicted AlkP superfamily phosphohydrolase/phosphomutase
MLPEVLGALPDSRNKTETYFSVVKLLVAREPRPRLVLAWIGLADAAEHKYWRYYEPEKFFFVSDGGVREYGGVIPRVYRKLDDFLGEVLTALPDDAVVIVCSDHGAGPVFGELKSGGHGDAPDGVLLMMGPPIKKDFHIVNAEIYDLMPTLCRVLGLPISREWRGRVLNEAIDSRWIGCAAQMVPAYPGPAMQFEHGGSIMLDDAVNEDMKAQLKELGYIQ